MTQVVEISCHECGATFENNTKYCSRCGAGLVSREAREEYDRQTRKTVKEAKKAFRKPTVTPAEVAAYANRGSMRSIRIGADSIESELWMRKEVKDAAKELERIEREEHDKRVKANLEAERKALDRKKREVEFYREINRTSARKVISDVGISPIFVPAPGYSAGNMNEGGNSSLGLIIMVAMMLFFMVLGTWAAML
jgi:ribosomal protein L37E